MLPIEDGFAAGSVQAIGDGAVSVVNPRRVESHPAAAHAASRESGSRVSRVRGSHSSVVPLKIGAEGGAWWGEAFVGDSGYVGDVSG